MPRKYKKKILLEQKPCEQCWETFTPKTNSNQRFCSEKCLKIYQREKQRGKLKQSLIDGSGHAYLRMRFEIFRRDGFACQYCGRTAKDGVKLHIDHILPKSKGGTLARSNLITACFDCNLGKSDVILTEREIAKLKNS